MNKRILFLFLLFLCLKSHAQQDYFKVFNNDTTFTSNTIFDYFRGEDDSVVYVIGSVFLIPSDSLSFIGDNIYTIKVINPKEGRLEIYFKNRLLYRYMLISNQVSGTGICYYPFSGNVALQGRFKNGKLDGLVFVQRENGEMIEIMIFKRGRYRNHLFHWLSLSKRSLKERSKNRSLNPLRNDEIIIR